LAWPAIVHPHGERLKLTKVNKSVSEIENMLSTDYQTYCKLGDTLWKDDINPIFLSGGDLLTNFAKKTISLLPEK
jgi:hypothetical protein